MPRRSRASLAAAEQAVDIPQTYTQPTAAKGPPLLDALEHIPPAPPNPLETDDDLTPPPAVFEAVDPNVSNGIDSEVKEEVELPKTPAKGKKGGRKSVKSQAGEPVVNIPPKRQRSTKKVKEEVPEVLNGVTEEPTTTTPKRKRSTKKAVASSPETANGDGGSDFEPDVEAEKPKRKTSKKPKAPTTPAKEEEGEEGEKPKRKTPKKSRIAKDEPEYDSEGNEIVKKKRKPKVYPKIEYDIPPIQEHKTTTFKGRLGYACLNTVLRKTKPDSIFCSRTCRIASIEEEGMELPKGLAMMNCKDLLTMIEWNEQNKIRFLRLSSEMFPFASHDKYGYDLSFAAKELKEAGDLANKYGHRITMHPGQFTQLGSPKDAVIKASIRELEYQCEILDRMGIDQDGVMIIHMGGIYGDKPSTLERFKDSYRNRLPDNVRARLVIENDEICYNVDDLMPVSEELGIPIIFDYHHDWINPSTEPPSVLIPKINAIWHKKGIRVKQHLSEPRPGAESVMEKRAHADRCKALPPDLPDDVDLMIEAKDKEQAVFELYRIYGLEDVIYDNLRPANPNPSLHTNGRKSSVKKKTKATGEVDSEGNSVILTDDDKDADGKEAGDESLVSNNTAAAAVANGDHADVKIDVHDGVAEEKPKRGRAKKNTKAQAAVSEPADSAETKEEVMMNGMDGAHEDAPPKKKSRSRKSTQ